jgi:hypothetical protein
VDLSLKKNVKVIYWLTACAGGCGKNTDKMRNKI